ncbi:kelch-like protein 13 [Dendronephthya gigantea]|uniref:kelch-like protein 13 n=1 Tax=Dendronephthya gigantea TaxID=151771 RepID=UPI00106B0EFC|nr:kelch-like protein 13 [Dendronephthya gigantea]
MEIETAMAGVSSSSSTKGNENSAFTLPWRDSDVILVVQDVELHVHKAMLALQSPVFEAMFNGQFQEAKAERIPLQGKTHKWMLQFIRLLYPANMTKMKVHISKENVFEILKLADEYQAANVISQCLAEVELAQLTNENALKLLPYAAQYDQAALSMLVNKVAKRIPVEQIGKFVPKLSDDKLALNLLLSKGRILERMVLGSFRVIETLLRFICKRETATSLMCGHVVRLSRYEDAAKCQTCIATFRTTFIDKAINVVLAAESSMSNDDKRVRAKLLGTLLIQVFNYKTLSGDSSVSEVSR